MNKKVLGIFALAIVALFVLWFSTFGPLSGRGASKANPASLRPIATQTVVGTSTLSLNTYHNRDLAENFYTIAVPQAWRLQSSNQAGGYQCSFANGTGTIGLQDVADNTTLELFVLSQDEPKIKGSVTGYRRIDYQKLSINGNDAYRLVYESVINGAPYETVKTYVAGRDHAGVITLTVAQNNFAAVRAVFDAVANSFWWENK